MFICKLIYNYFYPPVKRATIPKKTRELLWHHYHGNSNYGVCYACGDLLQKKNFHCSHVIPHCKGGDLSLKNIRTCCQNCNLRCGKKNLYDFILLNKYKGPGSNR